MKKIAVISASLGLDKKHNFPIPPLLYKDYVVNQFDYNNENTLLRQNSMQPRLRAKIPKMMGWLDLPYHDYYIWIDSTVVIWKDFIKDMMIFEDDVNADLFVFNHPRRSSIAEELEYMTTKMANGIPYLNSRYEGEMIQEQVKNYLSDSNYIDNRLFSGGCFMYTSRLVENRNYNLLTDWLMHNVLYSVQDQLSLPYLIQKHNIKYLTYQIVFGKIILDEQGKLKS